MTEPEYGEFVLGPAARPGLPEVVAVLDRHREEIATLWARLGCANINSPYLTMPFDDMCTRLQSTLALMSEALLSGSYGAMDRFFGCVSVELSAAGFDMGDLLASWLCGQEAVLHVIRHAYPADSELVLECVSQVNRCIRESTALYGHRYTAEVHRHLHKQQAQMAIMLNVLQTVSGSLDVREVLCAIAHGIAAGLGRRYYLCLITNQDRGELQPGPICCHLPATDLPADHVLTGHLFALCRTAFPAGQGQPQPVAWHWRDGGDLPAPPDANLRDVLLVPLSVDDCLLAVVAVVGYSDEPDRRFTPDEISLGQSLARSAAQALRNARLHQQVKQRAIVEERERLAGELHDDVSQVLGAVNWRMATLDRLLSNGDVDQAREVVRELKAVARQGYAGVREALVALRSASSLETDFLPALERYLADYQVRHGLTVELLADRASCPRFPIDVRLQTIRIIQEALTNVHKHARASQVCVAFSRDGGQIVIRIEDDGRGFEPARLAGEGRYRFGLSIMRDRATSLGGTLAIESAPGRGTCIELRLPLQAGE